MRLAVAGATHGIGRCVVEQGLARGHSVTAMGRHIVKLPLEHERLLKVSGDVTDTGDVSALLTGQDAVCFTVGIAPTLGKVTVFSQGTANILRAMRDRGVERLVAVTGIGAGESRGHGGFFYDRLFLPLLLRTIYNDKNRQEDMIRASAVKWTIVRPGFLSNGPVTGDYRVVSDLTGVTAGWISRADVAHFILQELRLERYVQQPVLLTS